jgi:predicted aspartyl protease
MQNISPLGALAALVVVGITVEVVERESTRAAYALVLVILLAMITFNAAAFQRQVQAIIAALNARSKKQSRGGAGFR